MNFAEYLSWRDPRIVSFDQYLLQDSPAGVFPSGLKFADGTKKPSYDAYPMPLYLPDSSGKQGTPVDVWGDVRPARYQDPKARASRRVEIQFKADSGGGFHTLDKVTLTDPYGYFEVREKFPSSGSVRTKWAYPGGPTIFSRHADVTIR